MVRGANAPAASGGSAGTSCIWNSWAWERAGTQIAVAMIVKRATSCILICALDPSCGRYGSGASEVAALVVTPWHIGVDAAGREPSSILGASRAQIAIGAGG